MTLHRILRTALACAMLAGTAAAHAFAIFPSPIVSTFDTDADGWTGVTTATGSPSWPITLTGLAVDYSSTDGSPAGSIRIDDPDSSWTYFRAPGKFLGDMSLYSGGTLSFDQRAVSTAGVTADANEAEVVLRGAGLVLVHEAIPSLSTSWTSLSVSLTAGHWRVSDTFSGALATQSQINAVLGNLTDLWINAEYYTPVVETIGLDNVMLTPVPEPSQAALLLAGAGLLGWRLSRRRSASR